MTRSHGWSLPEQHLLPDAIVAFVDGELAPGPARRAAEHLRQCASCAQEASAQRQASGAVRSAEVPAVPAGLLSSLRDIPSDVELPGAPEGLAVAQDGQLVMVQRPEKLGNSSHLGSGSTLGASRPLGDAGLGAPTLGGEHAHRHATRRAAQGAGVVVSGLVLGALALTLPQLEGQSSGNGSGPGATVPVRRPAGVKVARAEIGAGSFAVVDRRRAPAPPANSTPPVSPVSRPLPAGR